MRRIAPLTAVVVVPVVALLLGGCDDSSPATDAVDTVALGSLPGDLATAPATDATAASTAPTTDEPAARTDPVRSDPEPDATDPEPADPERSDPGRTASTQPERTTTTTVAPSTSFTVLLDRLVEDAPPASIDTSLLRDDTGRLGLAAPREWTDRRTEPSRLADGSDTPSVAASPDLTSFLDGYGTPGLTAIVVDDDPDGALAAYAFDEDCIGNARSTYRTPDVTGRYDVWESCGGTSNDIVTLAVRPDGADESVLFLVQVVDAADLAALDAAVASLTLGD
ncbi:MAG TPA: hypothetical protein VFT09_13475 [Ilumatobacteraceae bacterium]|nr:hypothetical protein [Ilumatobacteraceae bacterium]